MNKKKRETIKLFNELTKYEIEHACRPFIEVKQQYGGYLSNSLPTVMYKGIEYVSEADVNKINVNDVYHCDICNTEHNGLASFNRHLRTVHNIEPQVYYDKYIKRADEGFCKTCGKPTRFISLKYGYRLYCCQSCNNKDIIFRKRISTRIASDDWQKEHKKKMLKKYGVDSYAKTKEFKANYLEQWSDKIQAIEEENSCTLLWTLIQEFGQGWYQQQIVPTVSYDDHVYVKNKYINKIRKYAANSESGVSVPQQLVYDFIKEHYEGEVLLNTRKVIAPYELDIYIPELKLAVEVNGLRWHASVSNDNMMDKDVNYHLNKTELCLAKGIRLIHIFTDEIGKQETFKKIKSLLLTALGKYETKLYARNCEVQEVDNAEATSFLEENHLQGNLFATLNLGLYHKGELVALVNFRKSRYKKGEIELGRYCVKNGCTIVGGFAKLLKAMPYTEIVSYVDRSKFTGDSYLKNGFTLIGKTRPAYWYWKYKIGRVSRLAAQKHKLPKLLGKAYDSTKSETENMLAAGFIKVYDCGTYKMKFIKEGASNEKENKHS